MVSFMREHAGRHHRNQLTEVNITGVCQNHSVCPDKVPGGELHPLRCIPAEAVWQESHLEEASTQPNLSFREMGLCLQRCQNRTKDEEPPRQKDLPETKCHK